MISQSAEGNWERAWQGVMDIFSGILEGISGVCKSVINTIIGFINRGIRGLNKLTNINVVSDGKYEICAIVRFV